ncbi:MAG: phosphodiesterase [Stellaceae bacterium]
MLVAQITDMHILARGKLFHAPYRAIPPEAGPEYSRIDTGACLRRAVAALNALVPRPDVVVVTGDLTDHGNAEEYDHLREILAAAAMPLYVIPGNHDNREALRRAFAADGYLPEDGFLHYTVDHYPVRLVALDTHVPDSPDGELCGERLAWLDATLAAAPERPTLVMMHHPPFPTAIEHMDRHGLRDPDTFAAVIARHKQVERILCGHLHRTIDRRFAGTVAGTAPATAHQLLLDITPGSRGHFTFEPPGYKLHLWRDGGLITHTATLGDWPGPFPYHAPER